MLGFRPEMDLITLRAGQTGLRLAPGLGGAVARYWDDLGATTVDWLRPTAPDALGSGDPYRRAAFPLVPYSNRIREGRFVFQGRAVTLPLNRPPERHSIHGHGWLAAWTPIEVQASHAELEYRHAAGPWPWTYRARQCLALAPGRLTVELALTNESETPMPAGLGWHPYFPRTPRTTITAEVRAMWRTDAEVMPTELVPVFPPRDPGRGIRPDDVPLDNGFTGWSRRAVIEWPERRGRLVVTAEPPLDFLVLYTPPGRDFFCLEPVSHATDAVNLAAAGRPDTGLLTLEPGETVRAAVTLAPARLA
ncbi:MAG: aldose 1-epimerase [Candidatus Rokuibacteriota bacterium]